LKKKQYKINYIQLPLTLIVDKVSNSPVSFNNEKVNNEEISLVTRTVREKIEGNNKKSFIIVTRSVL